MIIKDEPEWPAWTVSAAMLTSIQSGGVAPEVNLRITQARKHPLKPRADVTRSSKQGYQWPHEKDFCPPNILEKKKGWIIKSIVKKKVLVLEF